MFSRHKKNSRRRNGEYLETGISLTNDDDEVEGDDCQLSSADELEARTMSLPPRYRFRDLLLGDFAFRDDGERWVNRRHSSLCFVCHFVSVDIANKSWLMAYVSKLCWPYRAICWAICSCLWGHFELISKFKQKCHQLKNPSDIQIKSFHKFFRLIINILHRLVKQNSKLVKTSTAIRSDKFNLKRKIDRWI